MWRQHLLFTSTFLQTTAILAHTAAITMVTDATRFQQVRCSPLLSIISISMCSFLYCCIQAIISLLRTKISSTFALLELIHIQVPLCALNVLLELFQLLAAAIVLHVPLAIMLQVQEAEAAALVLQALIPIQVPHFVLHVALIIFHWEHQSIVSE